MGQWLIVDTLLRRAGACGSRPTQAVREAGTPCERVDRIAPSKLERGIRNPEDWESRQRGRGARGAGRGAWRGKSWKESGRYKVQGARLSGMWNVECRWNVECSVEGRRCWWKEKVGEQDNTSRCTTLSQPARPHQHHRPRPHPPLTHSITVQIRYSTVPKHVLVQTHINPQPHLSICQ